VSKAKSRGAVKRRQQVTGDGKTSEPAARIAAMKEAGRELTADYWQAYIAIDEAARFLGTTRGEIYNLTSRGKIPCVQWSKRGLRFQRLVLRRWMEARRKLAST
jgi:excisionase family DNA binding protein